MNTLNNHLTYWYNEDKESIWRTSETDITSMSVGGCTRPTFSAKIEWRRNAQMIIDQYPDLTLFMSGGLDSEIAFRSFKAAGLKPRLVTIKFKDESNMYDIGPMMEMMKSEFNEKVEVIEFDPEEFCLSGEYLDIAEKYQSYTFYQQILMKVVEDFKEPMMSVDEVELEKKPTVDYNTGETTWGWVFLKKEDQDGVWRRFQDKTGQVALNNFYTYTPEAMLAFLNIPTASLLINDNFEYKYGWTSSKMRIYSEAGFKFRMRPKYHGMENYMHLWDYVEENRHPSLDSYTPVEYTIPTDLLKHNLEQGIETVCQHMS